MSADARALLVCTDVVKTYGGTGDPDASERTSTEVLRGVDLTLAAGESVSIVGPSGSGKSTLLNLVGALEPPTSGRIVYDGTDLASLDDDALADFRSREIGFVFQHHYLLPQCTALENVLVPTLARPGGDPAAARKRALGLLERVGLAARADFRPAELSGGERQRVAVVRALINEPRLLLADEPTGSLDSLSAASLGELLMKLNRERGLAVLLVTHSLDLAQRMQRVVELRGGRLVEAGQETTA